MTQAALQFILRLYQRLVSPLLPPACRFVPTCSEYALEAVERHGAARGLAKTCWRLLRCHPLAKGGYDPVDGDVCVLAGGHTGYYQPGRPAGSPETEQNFFVNGTPS